MLTFDALFKRYEMAKAFSLNADTVLRDAKRVKKRLRDSNRLLLDPESRMMQWWDLATILSLFWTLLISPYEIGFMDEYNGIAKKVLFWVNQTITLIFLTDLVLNFFRPFRDALGQKVKSHWVIGMTYVKSWLILDIISTVPFDLLSQFVFAADEEESASGASNSQLLSLVRILRLLKLFRIMRASRLFARWSDRIEYYVSVSHATRTLLWWTFMLVTTIHWFCCGWGLMAQLYGNQRSEALSEAVALDGTCAGCMPDDPSSAICRDPCLLPCELSVLAKLNNDNEALTYRRESWICRGIYEGVFPTSPDEHLYRYLSTMSMFGQLSPTNDAEYLYAFFVAFLWLMMQNAFIGILCGTIADGDRHAKEYKQRMDELNYFLRDMQAPRELAVRAREHCRATRSLFKKYSYQKLFEVMSPMLRGDLAQQMSMRTLENVWYFAECETELMRALSEKLQPLGFARGEKIFYSERLNIVTKGAAARGGKILTLDHYWGEDMIVSSKALRDTRYSSALTYVEITTLTRHSLEECLLNYPKSERTIRCTALKIAMQRAGQIIANHLHKRDKLKALSGVLGNSITDALETQAHHKMLREMMGVINGGQKLRKYDEGADMIVDENNAMINADYVRKQIEANRGGMEQSMNQLKTDVSAIRKGVEEGSITAEREAIRKEREAIANEREAYRKLLLAGKGASSGREEGSRRDPPDRGGGGAASATTKSARPRSASRSPGRSLSPTGTATPPRHTRPGTAPGALAKQVTAFAKAGREAAEGAPPTGGSVDFIKGEKRYRRRKKGSGGDRPTSPDLSA